MTGFSQRKFNTMTFSHRLESPLPYIPNPAHFFDRILRINQRGFKLFAKYVDIRKVEIRTVQINWKMTTYWLKGKRFAIASFVK